MGKIKVTEFSEVAGPSGVPCHGDLFSGEFAGNTYRAEFYLEPNFGMPYAAKAADSTIERQTPDGEWVEVDDLDDDTFNAILDAITPEVVA